MRVMALVVALVVGIAGGYLLRKYAAPPPPPYQNPLPAVAPPYPLALFLLAGQSNISGRASPPRDLRLPTNVWVFGNDYRWHPLSTAPVDSHHYQLDMVSDDLQAGYCLAIPFCRELRRQGFRKPIGLIPCARGASPLVGWQRNRSDLTLYGSMLKRARAASPMGEFAGLLWYQGETDAGPEGTIPGAILFREAWAAQFQQIIGAFRTDLDAPTLPVVYACLAENTAPGYYRWWDVVKKSQREVHLPVACLADLSGLSLEDNVHLDTTGTEEAGRRFAAAWRSLTAPRAATPGRQGSGAGG